MSTYRYCGRDFSDEEVSLIGSMCQDPATSTREAIARAVCSKLSWRRMDGALKTMSAKVALLRMEGDGLIVLPAPRNTNGNGRGPLRLAPGDLPAPIDTALSCLSPLELRPVSGRESSATWNDLVARHHYLGHHPLPGAQRRYFVSGQGQLLALFGFGAAAWKCAPRDAFIGWEPHVQARKLSLVVGNARFLILPWVRVPNLASAALGLMSRSIGDDWEAAYGYRPELLETFVESARFSGTSYKAANWVHVGKTQGRGKLDRRHEHGLAVKDVYVLPLTRHFRRSLCAPA